MSIETTHEKTKITDATEKPKSFWRRFMGHPDDSGYTHLDYTDVDPGDFIDYTEHLEWRTEMQQYNDRLDVAIGELAIRGFFDTADAAERERIADNVAGSKIRPEAIFLQRRSLEDELKEEYLLASYRVNRLFRNFQETEKRGLVVAYAGLKGGTAKSPTATNSALALSFATQKPAHLIDANPHAGLDHKIYGINRNGYPLYPRLLTDPSFTDGTVVTMSNLPKQRQTEVYLTPADPVGEHYNELTTTETVQYIQSSREKFPITCIDLGTGSESPSTKAAIAEADVIVFSVNSLNKLAAGVALENIMNLADTSEEHLQKVRVSSRLVFSGIEKTHSNVTLDHEIGKHYRDTLIASAREWAELHEREEWTSNPLLLLEHYGLAKEDEDGVLKVDDSKIDFISYSELIDSSRPTSVLRDELGDRPSIDYLLFWERLLTETTLQRDDEKQPLRLQVLNPDESRAKPSDEKPALSGPIASELLEATKNMPFAELEAYAKALVTRLVEMREQEGGAAAN